MAGSYKKDLFSGTFHEHSITALRRVMAQFVYSTDAIIRMELSAQTIITFLLDRFIPAILCYGQNNCTEVDERHIKLIPECYKNDYLQRKTDDEVHNLYLRLLIVTDFISSMTDSYAKNLYQELNGII